MRDRGGRVSGRLLTAEVPAVLGYLPPLAATRAEKASPCLSASSPTPHPMLSLLQVEWKRNEHPHIRYSSCKAPLDCLSSCFDSLFSAPAQLVIMLRQPCAMPVSGRTRSMSCPYAPSGLLFGSLHFLSAFVARSTPPISAPTNSFLTFLRVHLHDCLRALIAAARGNWSVPSHST